MPIILTSSTYLQDSHLDQFGLEGIAMKKGTFGVIFGRKSINIMQACEKAQENSAALNYFKQAYKIRVSNILFLSIGLIVSFFAYEITGTNFLATIIGVSFFVILSIIYRENVRNNYIISAIDLFNKSL